MGWAALRGAPCRYLLLYLALYLGWGVLTPFLPVVLAGQGARAEEIGLILGLGMAVRLLVTPLAGMLADRWAAPRTVLGVVLVLGALLVLGYGVTAGFAGLLLVGLFHAAVSGPAGTLPDALALRALATADRSPGRTAVRGSLSMSGQSRGSGLATRLDYGVVRGAGAAAFIAGTALAGFAVGASGGPEVVLGLHAGCFLLAAGAVPGLPVPPLPADSALRRTVMPGRLLAVGPFRGMLLVTALIQGSHALYTGYASLRWEAAGLSPEAIGLLWSLGVASEVGVFLLFGRHLLARFGPGGVGVLAAAAGALRWSVMATTASLPAMLLVQPLHGLTFAAQHLAAMAVIARVVPPGLGATALSLYATLGSGLSGALLTVASGLLYAQFGAAAFWAMTLLCLAALLPARALQRSLAE